MGMSAWYGETDEAESIATIQRALELGIFFLDTADIYGAEARRERDARRQGDRGTPRRGRARDEVRQRLRGGQAEHQRQARVRSRGAREVARAPERRLRRPLLPASRRQDRSDRRDGRSDGGARRGGQGAPPRPLGGVAGDDPARACDASDHRAAERVLAVDARPRGQRGARNRARPRHRLRRLLAARPRVPHRARSRRRTTSPTTTSASTTRVFRARTSSGTSRSSRACRSSRRRRA